MRNITVKVTYTDENGSTLNTKTHESVINNGSEQLYDKILLELKKVKDNGQE